MSPRTAARHARSFVRLAAARPGRKQSYEYILGLGIIGLLLIRLWIEPHRTAIHSMKKRRTGRGTMRMSSTLSNHRYLKSSILLLLQVLLLYLPRAVSAQNRDGDASSVPLELTPADPEIRDLLQGEFDSCKTFDPDGRA